MAPSGRNRRTSYERMLNGVSAVRKIERFDTSGFKSKVAAVVDEVSHRPKVEDRHVELALRASEQALAEAGLAGGTFGLVFATAVGASATLESSYRARSHPSSGSFQFDLATSAIARETGIKGPRYTQTTGCTAGLDAVGFAHDIISAGLGDTLLVVAAEAPVAPIVLASFDKIGAVSRHVLAPHRASRPFHIDRDGFVLGEGAAAVLLEHASAVEKRGAKPLCRLLGWHSVSSGFHMTAIRSDGSDIAGAVAGALAAAHVNPREVDVVDLHATSTKQNDLAEANALSAVFGRRGCAIPVMAQKGLNGHALGASSLMELVNSITALEHQTLIPCANLDRQDPSCRVLAPTEPTCGRFRTLVKVASGFSGIHTAAVIGLPA